MQDKKASGEKSFAVLIDPEKVNVRQLDKILSLAVDAHVDYLLVGGSIVVDDALHHVVQSIKTQTNIPCVLFPGNFSQIHHQADAILLLSLISGRNPDLLIGQHVLAAPKLKKSQLEILPTGYMLVDGGVDTAVSYISNTRPIPRQKADIALCTALAGQMLGLQTIYLDAGSGARHSVPLPMISAVSSHVDVPIIVGGGIRTPESAAAAARAGADLIVVGTAIEDEPHILTDISAAIHAQAKAPITS